MKQQNDIYSLAKLLGAKNITESPFARSPVGLNYVNQQSRSELAAQALANASNPGEAIGAGINYYVQSKRQQKAIDELGAQLKAEADAAEQKRSALADLFPEEQRPIAHTLDMETLQKFAANKLLPKDPNADLDAQLDRDYKRAQINNLNSQANNRGQSAPPKPLPSPVVKAQNEELDTLGTVKGINADLSKVYDQIDSGKLKLGPVENIVSAAKNYSGNSDQNSRNFASFKSTLEKQRNDSLRLNKGVQTEGDAQRAWNELFQNLNDSNLVKQRLAEIQAINNRAAELKKLNINNLRANYGHEPLDYSEYENRPAAIGAQEQAPHPQADQARAILQKRGVKF